jgi:hypothetical protein
MYVIVDLLCWFVLKWVVGKVDYSKKSSLVSLCFSLSVLGRRALGTASQNQSAVYVQTLVWLVWRITFVCSGWSHFCMVSMLW